MSVEESTKSEFVRAVAKALAILCALITWQVLTAALYPETLTEGEFYEAMSAGDDQALEQYMAGRIVRAGGSLAIVFTGLVIVAARMDRRRIRRTAAVAALVPQPLHCFYGLIIVLGSSEAHGTTASDWTFFILMFIAVSIFFAAIGVAAALASHVFRPRPSRA